MSKELMILTVPQLNHLNVDHLPRVDDKIIGRTILLIAPPLPALFFLLPLISADVEAWYPQEMQRFKALAAQWSIPSEWEWVKIGAFKTIFQRTLDGLKPTRVYTLCSHGWQVSIPHTAILPLFKKLRGLLKKQMATTYNKIFTTD